MYAYVSYGKVPSSADSTADRERAPNRASASGFLLSHVEKDVSRLYTYFTLSLKVTCFETLPYHSSGMCLHALLLKYMPYVCIPYFYMPYFYYMPPVNVGAFIICAPIARTALAAVSCDDASNLASRSRISDVSRSRISDISISVGSTYWVG